LANGVFVSYAESPQCAHAHRMLFYFENVNGARFFKSRHLA